MWTQTLLPARDTATAGASASARPERRALLQGWALFDNTLDEDLENVSVTFVAGMPVSFIYDLYTPFTPERPGRPRGGRGVAAPVEFEAAMAMPAPVAVRRPPCRAA